jgi:hypothetical protein
MAVHFVCLMTRVCAADAANAETAKAAEKERASSTAAAIRGSNMFAVTPLLASRARSSMCVAFVILPFTCCRWRVAKLVNV